MSLSPFVLRALSAPALLCLLAGSSLAQPCVDGGVADRSISITAENRIAPGVTVGGNRNQVAVGDVNNDGFDDVILGFSEATFGEVGDVTRRGVVRVISGQDDSIIHEFTGDTWATPSEVDGFGWRVASADVTGDGFDDVIIGVRLVNDNQGRLDVFSGATGSFLYSINGLGVGFGEQVLNIGDITGDGRDDLLVSIPGFNPAGGDVPPGAISIHSGANGALIDSSVGGGLNPRLGRVVGFLPDLNNDGVNEVFVGTNQSIIAFDPTDLSAGLWIRLVDQFGGRDLAAATVGDLDNDGIGDLAVVNNGVFSVLSGATGMPVIPEGLELFSPGGVATARPYSDINADGVEDFLLAVRGTNGSSEELLYIDAATGDILARRTSPVVFDPDIDDSVTGYAAGIAVGDVNNDGSPDAIVTRVTTNYIAAPFSQTLTAFVYEGVPCPGDVNADGAVDFADLNATLASFGQSGSGIVGDGDCSGSTDFGDLNTVLAAFGSSCD